MELSESDKKFVIESFKNVKNGDEGFFALLKRVEYKVYQDIVEDFNTSCAKYNMSIETSILDCEETGLYKLEVKSKMSMFERYYLQSLALERVDELLSQGKTVSIYRDKNDGQWVWKLEWK